MNFKEELGMIQAMERAMNLTSGDTDIIVKQKHEVVLKLLNNTLPYYKDKDIVEFEHTLIPPEKIQVMWENLHVYSYDMDKFFINEGVLHLYENGKLMFKICFTIDPQQNINIIATLRDTNEIVSGGTIVIREGKFVPNGCVNDKYYDIFKADHIKEGLSVDRQFIADRLLLNAFSNLIIINQYVTNHKDIVIETSKRVELKPKSKKKKKHQPKKTKQIRTIKIDTQKVKRIQQQYQENLEKREFERHTQQWTRRGHYRKLRNGVVKWFEPQIVTAKDKCKEDINTKKVYKVQ